MCLVFAKAIPRKKAHARSKRFQNFPKHITRSRSHLRLRLAKITVAMATRQRRLFIPFIFTFMAKSHRPTGIYIGLPLRMTNAERQVWLDELMQNITDMYDDENKFEIELPLMEWLN